MRFLSVPRNSSVSPAIFTAVLLATACSLSAQKPAPTREDPAKIVQGMPPRATPSDYQSQGKAGNVTIAAEFVGHSAPTPTATFTTEEYVVVETALFGPAGQRLILSPDDFSLRVNGKKAALPSQPWGLAVKSMKDPEWEAAQVSVSGPKSKTAVGGSGGGGGQGDPPPPPPKMSIEVRRAMELKVQKASFPEGDRALPQAGLIFFQYSGKLKGIKSLELLYSGPAGKGVVALQP